MSKIIEVIANKTGLPKKAVRDVVEALAEHVESEIKAGGSVRLANLGAFHPLDRIARTGRNPATGAEISIPASRKVGFKASSACKWEH